MGTRRGVVCELHDWSADSEFTELLKGRYITDVVDDEILVICLPAIACLLLSFSIHV